MPRPSDTTEGREHTSRYQRKILLQGIESGIYHWYPVFGGGDADFTFKWIESYADHTALGRMYEIMGNGGLYPKQMELFNNLLECDVARVYNAKNRRKAQVR